MADKEVVVLDEGSPQLRAPQSGNRYIFPRAAHFQFAITTDSTIDGRDVAADGALAASASQPGHTHTESEITDFGTYLVAADLEGTAVLSTGESGGSKFLREDGDGSCSWVAIPGGGDALVANPLSQFAATTSLQLLGVISDETGTGKVVFATSPALVTPTGIVTNDVTESTDKNYVSDTELVVIGNTSGSNSGDQTNISGNAATVTTNANLTGHVTSTGNAAILGTFTLAQLNTAVSDATIENFKNRDIAFTDETSDLTTGDDKATFHMPNYATTLLEVSVGVTTAPTGTAAIFDLTEAGTTVLSTLITIDAGEKTSEDAGTPPVISDSALAANALMTVNIDQIGSGVAGAGAKLYVKYKRA